MFVDSLLKFSDAQAVTSSGATASTDIIDTRAAHDEGIGEEMYLVIQCKETAAGTMATTQFKLQTSVDSAFTSPIDAYASAAIAKAALLKDTTIIKIRLPIGLKRYLRVAYVTDAAATAGKYTAMLVKDVEAHQYTASGFSVQ